mgnify:CR=1 FL=1
MADINTLKTGLIVTAFWEAKPGEVDALVGVIREFLPQAQAEPGDGRSQVVGHGGERLRTPIAGLRLRWAFAGARRRAAGGCAPASR